MNKVNKLNDYLSDRTLEKILDNFTRATGTNLIIRDIRGEQVGTVTNHSRLWEEIVKNEPAKNAAFDVLRTQIDASVKSGQIQIFNRYFDTYTFIVPIYVEGRISAFFISGLTRFGNPKTEECIKEAEKFKLSLDDYLEMYLELPLVTKDKFEASANLLKVIATALTTLSKEENEIKAKISHISSINDFLKQEIKNSSTELKLSETRYYNLFNHITDGAYITDIKGIVIDINPAGANLLGYEPHELIGTNFKDVFVNPEDREKYVVKVIIDKGILQNYHPFVRLKSGETKYFETNAVPIRNENNEIIGIQGIFRDISHRPHLKIKSKKSNESEHANITSHQHDQVASKKT
jgi:PAS domain S-box-containing protein